MSKSQRIIISLPGDLLTELDGYVKKYSYNRSEAIRRAIRDLIKDETKSV